MTALSSGTRPQGYRFVLTADRSQMSNYRGNFLFGFLSCGPAKLVPRLVYNRIFCPTDDTIDRQTGKAVLAPLGTRRIESALAMQFGEDISVAHPLGLNQQIGARTEVVGLSEMDPVGMSPVTTAYSWSNEPWNKRWFSLLTGDLKRLKRLFRFKVVLGGAGAWQFESKPMREAYGIDHVVLGEADDKAAGIFQDITDGTAPEVIRTYTNTIESIPEIRAPTLTGIIECMRGCGRGCDFCAPNLRKKRDFPVERLRREAKVNADWGFQSIWLHSEELTLYGCESKDMVPNRDAIVDLYKQILSVPGIRKVGATHWTFAGVCADPELIAEISKLNRLGPASWMGVQPGLETASPKLVRKHMPFKVKPFSPEEYPEIIKEGIRIMNQNYYYPANTLIIGQTGEDNDDLQMTIDLVEQLKGTHCILAPLLYVDYWRPEKTATFATMNRKQWELYYKCWIHNLRQFTEKVWLATQSFNLPERLFTYGLTRTAAWAIMRFLRDQMHHRFGEIPNFAA